MRFIFLVIMSAVLISLTGCQKEPPITQALVYENAKQLKPFELTDQNGQIISNEALIGSWNFLFLGYTSCPDICPMTLAKLQQVKRSLSSEFPVKVWFVSVDPNRDNSEKLKLYTQYFDPEFIAATADHPKLFPFVRDIGLMYAMADSKLTQYSVDHSASIALIDAKGQLRAIFKPEFAPNAVPTINTDQLIDDFKKIARFY